MKNVVNLGDISPKLATFLENNR